jgi:hypothetical protein
MHNIFMYLPFVSYQSRSNTISFSIFSPIFEHCAITNGVTLWSRFPFISSDHLFQNDCCDDADQSENSLCQGLLAQRRGPIRAQPLQSPPRHSPIRTQNTQHVYWAVSSSSTTGSYVVTSVAQRYMSICFVFRLYDKTTFYFIYYCFSIGRRATVIYVGFEVFTAVVLKSIFFWDMTPCSALSGTRRFGGTYRLHLQGRRIVQQSSEQASGKDPEDGGDTFFQIINQI